MLKSLIYYERCDFYFNYGVFSKQDCDLINSMVKLFSVYSNSFYPSSDKFNSLSIVVGLIESNRITQAEKNIYNPYVCFLLDCHFFSNELYC